MAVISRSRAASLGKTRTLLVRRLISCWMARSMGALDGIGCAHAAAVLVGEAEHGEPLGHSAFQPGCQLGGGAQVGLDEPVQLFLGAHQGGGIPDAAEFSADGFADGRIRRVVDGVLSQMKLAALCHRAPGKTAWRAARSPA